MDILTFDQFKESFKPLFSVQIEGRRKVQSLFVDEKNEIQLFIIPINAKFGYVISMRDLWMNEINTVSIKEVLDSVHIIKEDPDKYANILNGLILEKAFEMYSSHIVTTLGSRLIRARKKKGCGLKIALEMGRSSSWLSGVEKNRVSPRISELRELSKLYEIDLSCLLDL